MDTKDLGPTVKSEAGVERNCCGSAACADIECPEGFSGKSGQIGHIKGFLKSSAIVQCCRVGF